MRNLPIGIRNFENIIKRNYIYVDKTKKLQNLIEEGECYFLSRPEGFGKSLTLSTIEAMFRGRYAIFQGLAAATWVQNAAKHPNPVLRLDFAKLNTQTVDAFNVSLYKQLEATAKEYALPQTKDLETIINALYEKYGSIAVLLANYDDPITRIQKDNDLLLPIYNILRNFYRIIDAYRERYRFLLVLGSESYEETGIYATLKSLNDITHTEQFADIIGFTQEELEEVLSLNNTKINYYLEKFQKYSNIVNEINFFTRHCYVIQQIFSKIFIDYQ